LGTARHALGELRDGQTKKSLAARESELGRDLRKGFDKLAIDERDSQLEPPRHAHHVAVTKELVAHVPRDLEVADLVLNGRLRRRGVHPHRTIGTWHEPVQVSTAEHRRLLRRKDASYRPIGGGGARGLADEIAEPTQAGGGCSS